MTEKEVPLENMHEIKSDLVDITVKPVKKICSSLLTNLDLTEKQALALLAAKKQYKEQIDRAIDDFIAYVKVIVKAEKDSKEH